MGTSLPIFPFLGEEEKQGEAITRGRKSTSPGRVEMEVGELGNEELELVAKLHIG